MTLKATAHSETRGSLCSISCQPSAAELCSPTPTTSRNIVRASLAAMRGDPPSVTGQHCAAKKRARVDAQGAQLSPS